MLKTGLWIAVVGFLLALASRVFWMLSTFNNDWYAEEWYFDANKAFQVVDTIGAVIIIFGLVLAASGAGRTIRAGHPGQMPGSYAAPGQQYPAPAGGYQQQQPWAQPPQSPMRGSESERAGLTCRVVARTTWRGPAGLSEGGDAYAQRVLGSFEFTFDNDWRIA